MPLVEIAFDSNYYINLVNLGDASWDDALKHY